MATTEAEYLAQWEEIRQGGDRWSPLHSRLDIEMVRLTPTTILSMELSDRCQGSDTRDGTRPGSSPPWGNDSRPHRLVDRGYGYPEKVRSLGQTGEPTADGNPGSLGEAFLLGSRWLRGTDATDDGLTAQVGSFEAAVEWYQDVLGLRLRTEGANDMEIASALEVSYDPTTNLSGNLAHAGLAAPSPCVPR